MQGVEKALDAGAKEVAIIASASEAFSQHTEQCSIAESLAHLKPMVRAAREADVAVRGYVSCVVGCPFQVPVLLGWHYAVHATLRNMLKEVPIHAWLVTQLMAWIRCTMLHVCLGHRHRERAWVCLAGQGGARRRSGRGGRAVWHGLL